MDAGPMPDTRQDQQFTSAELRQARAALVAFGTRMAEDGLAVGSAGNLSVRLGDMLLITPSGVDYDQISEPGICVLDAEGHQLDGDGIPSSECPMHRMIYTLTGARAVVHTHSRAAVALSAVCEELPAVHYSILRLGGPSVRVAQYQTFGSEELARSTAAALDGRHAALLQNHGAVAYGASLAEAYHRAQLLEWLADVYWRAKLFGEPRILDDAELAAVREQSRRRYAAGGG
jgi:L-fuculose-phosphate aldolase